MFFSEEKNQKTFECQGKCMATEFQLGWEAAIVAVRQWHESQAKKTLIEARRSRFPKNLEREAEVHKRSAEMIATLSPDDV